MTLKDEVCSFEHSKRLKELGIKNDSPFQWVEVPKTYSIDSNLVKTITSTEIKLVFGEYATLEGGYIDHWQAFTIGQLFELLPAWIDTGMDQPFNNFWLYVQKRSMLNIQYIAIYICDTMPGEEAHNPIYQIRSQAKAHDAKLADCLAKCLIYLIENDLYIKRSPVNIHT